MYVALDTFDVYMWNEDLIRYVKIGADARLPEEQLIPLIEEAVQVVLVDKLEEEIPPIVEKTISESILYGGSSSDKDDTL